MNILALILASLFAGIAPMLMWALFLWWFDRYEKEPLPLLAASFLWGFIPSAAALIAVENTLYFAFGSEDIASFACLVILRGFVFGLNHAFSTSLTGIGLALARYQRNVALKLAFPALGLGAAMVAHGLHNAGATLAAVNVLGLLISLVSDYAGVLLVFVVIILSLRREGSWIREYLQEEVALGTLTKGQLSVAASAPKRLAASWGAFLSLDLSRWLRINRFYQKCAELAYKKHQARRMGDERGNRAIVERLRSELVVESGRLPL